MLNGDPEHKHYGIKTMPNVSYLAKVVNKEESSSNHHGQKVVEIECGAVDE